MASPVPRKITLSKGNRYHLQWLDKTPTNGVATFAQKPPPLGDFSMELLIEIWKMTGGLEASRVWLNTIYSPSPSGGAPVTHWGTRAPPPVNWGITPATRAGTRTAYDYIELKRNATDAKGLVFSLSMDMVFIEPTYQFSTDFVPFAEALKDAQAVDRLRSIAIWHELVTIPSGKPENMSALQKKRISEVIRNRQILSTFSGLELVFLVYGQRPAAHKQNEPCVRLFDLVRKTEFPSMSQVRTELENVVARNGAVPTIVFVEYQNK